MQSQFGVIQVILMLDGNYVRKFKLVTKKDFGDLLELLQSIEVIKM